MVNALILAGDKGEDGKPKALLEIKGRFMIEYVIDALRDSGVVDNIYVVGDEILKDKIGHVVDGFIKSNGEMLDNIKYSVKSIGDYERPLLVCTSDIPLIKGDAVRDFVLECSKENLDVGYPIIDKSLNDEKYPDVKRTYVKMKEGIFTGGNIVFLNPNVVERATKRRRSL
ncbi:nucleotidyltransferase family protein [Caloramator sp. Dgby_cultured_2]|uniref:nucleotidyltransferase family protein n=1 Tax=Caloramator sp. Dgby_cultured_2 TaxID=3029174 RepID=UPI00237D823B|nr:nucleotidyltransferase family protein [Caloramator sp. Dgby_cultured_2]WDU82607.1 nucleotidyltransferase family protein [Caloramator sp. Dgby_cultured_2]